MQLQIICKKVAERAHARQHHTIRLAHDRGIARDDGIEFGSFEGFRDTAKIARAVINEGDFGSATLARQRSRALP